MAGMNGAGPLSPPGDRAAAVSCQDAVALVRYRPDTATQAGRTVHLLPGGRSATTAVAGAVTTLCGALLVCAQIETVNPGEGMPCTMCLLLRCSCAPAIGGKASGEAAAARRGGLASPAVAVGYRAWAWPVIQSGDQVLLVVEEAAVATIIPAGLAVDVVSILTAQRCPVAVLVHPHVPEHRVLLSGEPYGVPLPWPPQVHTATGTIPLPPTVTPRGPVTWTRSPQPHALRMCREIDVFAAVRTALRAPT